MNGISTIVVTKNSGEHVLSCLDSILSQTVQPDEIIVMDKSSDKVTIDIIRRYEDKVRVYIQNSNGLANARNEALDHCKGAYISFLDADDIWMPDKLEKQLEVMEGEPNLDLASCLLRKIQDGQTSETFEALTPSGCLFRREVFQRYDKFNPQYRIAADHSWFLTSIRQGINIHMIQEVLMLKQVHDRNLSLHTGEYRKELMQLLHSIS